MFISFNLVISTQVSNLLPFLLSGKGKNCGGKLEGGFPRKGTFLNLDYCKKAEVWQSVRLKLGQNGTFLAHFF